MTENQKLREAFETYITDDGKWPNAILKAPGGQYLLLRTSVAWQDWKACAEALALLTVPAISDTWGISRALVTLYAYECDGATDKALALITADHFPDATKMIETAAPDAQHRALKGTPCPTCSGRGDLGLPLEQTAAPDMPLSMNQFGRLVELTREHLTDNTFVYKATSTTGDTCHFGVESAAKAWSKGGTVEPIKVREFKLHTSGPTSDHLPNAGKMINGLTQSETDASASVSGLTAAPVGEREAFEAWLGITPCGAAHDFGWAAWQARAALRAGDAVDEQRYRWLMDNCTLGIKQNGVGWSLNTTACIAPDCIKDVGATIDAAMRKGQL